MRVMLTLAILLMFNYAHGYTDCVEIDHGLSCYDYERRSFTEITPRDPEPDGSRTFDTYDYDTGEFGTIRVEPGRLQID